jgi:hypothetical protein
MQVQHDAVGVADRDELAEHVGLVIELLRRFSLEFWRGADADAEPAASQLAQPGDHGLGLVQDRSVPAPVPHRADERRADHRLSVLFGKRRQAFHGLIRSQRGLHHFDPLHPGVFHVGEHRIKDRSDVVIRLAEPIDPRAASDNDSVGFGACRWSEAKAGATGGGRGAKKTPSRDQLSISRLGGLLCAA